MISTKLQGYILYYESKKTCTKNYVTNDGLVNGANSLFKTTTCVNNKSYIWIDFLNPKIRYHTQHKNAYI